MSTHTRNTREFTGRHMLLTILGFFGVVVAVNLTMAALASKSWTGLVVENTYVASQLFNKKAEEGRAQAALGWTGNLTIARSEVRYSLSDATGKQVPVHGVKILFRHPAYEAKDKSVTLAFASAQEFAGQDVPEDGVWIVEVDADVGLAEPYRDVRRIMISQGALQ
ncbi:MULTISPECIES: FixH family protein [Mesorhizobium]|uniref:FixH family protein n=1 Tax=Mesorhizobium TaxID=68287 RepID=UPI000BB06B4E|nr:MULTISPECIES: FixH family protein [Mesorhizobium]PBB39674.1 cytochrome oxidase [Mesorhizobium sp. WSM3868]PBB40760.1 cytochrome oxidase [Mesorhizobium sp. WSM3866]PBB58920.1 cytochrome oxidase [Mesorhizobium loti]PBB80139.1 cytochrome oxidase [Mesorhizobium sp. WSM3879]PBB85118.1 cytochrome oxidase [Mesorhizobium sp. WSM3876]